MRIVAKACGLVSHEASSHGDSAAPDLTPLGSQQKAADVVIGSAEPSACLYLFLCCYLSLQMKSALPNLPSKPAPWQRTSSTLTGAGSDLAEQHPRSRGLCCGTKAMHIPTAGCPAGSTEPCPRLGALPCGRTLLCCCHDRAGKKTEECACMVVHCAAEMPPAHPHSMPQSH